MIILMDAQVKSFIEENFPVLNSHIKVDSFNFILKKFKRVKKDEKLSDAILSRISFYSNESSDWKLVEHLELLKGIELSDALKNDVLVKFLNDIGIDSFIELVVLIEEFPYALFQVRGVGEKTYKEIISKVYDEIEKMVSLDIIGVDKEVQDEKEENVLVKQDKKSWIIAILEKIVDIIKKYF
jgi:hypothetical protein